MLPLSRRVAFFLLSSFMAVGCATTAASDRTYKMTTERLRTPDELNELKKGVAGSGKDECYTTILVQL